MIAASAAVTASLFSVLERIFWRRMTITSSAFRLDG
jgi:hypothetical protein